MTMIVNLFLSTGARVLTLVKVGDDLLRVGVRPGRGVLGSAGTAGLHQNVILEIEVRREWDGISIPVLSE